MIEEDEALALEMEQRMLRGATLLDCGCLVLNSSIGTGPEVFRGIEVFHVIVYTRVCSDHALDVVYSAQGKMGRYIIAPLVKRGFTNSKVKRDGSRVTTKEWKNWMRLFR